MTALLSVLIFSAPLMNPFWGVQMGASVEQVAASFTTAGAPKGFKWTRSQAEEITTLSYRCAPSDGCFSVPAEAQFYFLQGRLAAATFLVQQEQAPTGLNVLIALRSAVSSAGFLNPIASQSAVGRRLQYFHRDGQTLVWAQDGPDAELKWYADHQTPVGRAEAVASGAELSLASYPGASGYSVAHQAIMARDYGRAAQALEAAMTEAKVSPLLKREAKYVLAMVLAAEVKVSFSAPNQTGPSEKAAALKKLDRAARLAPNLAVHFRALKTQLGLK